MTPVLPTDLVTFSQAAAHLPPGRQGRRRNRATVHRWALAGKFRAWKVAGILKVSLADVLAYAQPQRLRLFEVAPRRRSQREEDAAQRRADVVLRRFGIIGDSA